MSCEIMMTPMKHRRHRMIEAAFAEDGVAATEYALIIGMFAVAALVAMWLFGGTLTETFSLITDQVPEAFGGSHSGATESTMLTHGRPPHTP